jgi:aspartyl-tRNA(Asn)/glutamyl-tRNA(Gln) amidotransferase subunit C
MTEQQGNHKVSNKDSPINFKLVRKVANLIHIDFDDGMAEIYSQQFSEIIKYFELLQKIDTNGVLPANETGILSNVSREDVITHSINREEFLKNVPEIKKAFVKIPKIFDGR